MNTPRRRQTIQSIAQRRRLSAAGMATKSTPYGVSLQPTNANEEFYIRLKSKGTLDATGAAPYSWETVVRNTQNTWTATGQTGGPGFDPAYEANNADSPINTVYRAYRDPGTGQVLFF